MTPKTTILQSAKQAAASIAVFASRLGLLPANISPLGTFGFFSRYPWIYFLSIIVFDRFVGGLYRGFWFTYLGFAGYPLFGWLARRYPKKTALLIPLASFWFFLWSNFGSFWYWYPHSLSGLLLCYTLAVPFYSRTLIGDLVFGYGYLVVRERKRIISWAQCTLHKVLFQPLPQ